MTLSTFMSHTLRRATGREGSLRENGAAKPIVLSSLFGSV